MRARFVVPIGFAAFVLGCSGGSGGEEPVNPDALDDSATSGDGLISSETEGVDGSADSAPADETGAAEDAGDDSAADASGGDAVLDAEDSTLGDIGVAADAPGDAPDGAPSDALSDVDVDAGADSTMTVTCTTCHGDKATGNPTPPRAIGGSTLTTTPGVGAHAKHLGTSTWRRDVVCTDCHVVPTDPMHPNGVKDFAWSTLATAGGATPMYDTTTHACSGTYCHGVTLEPAATGGVVKREPIFNQVDGSFSACGASCHTTPPGGKHPANPACPTCHGAVIATWDPVTKTATWKDRSLHVDGIVELTTLTCTTCHGDATRGDPAPPMSTKGATATTAQGVGAHQAHLTTSTWRKDMACTDCHVVPTAMTHFDGKTDFAWGALARTRASSPAYDVSTATCSTVYCHGNGLMAAKAGATVARAPVWNVVDGTWDACGTTCHTNPPGGTHPASDACASCHGAVIASYNPTTRAATWTNRALHVDGVVQTSTLTCTSCHGDPAVNDAPPKGTKGETLTSQAAVGAHQTHLATSAWHRDVVCADCHVRPTSMSHATGTTDFSWSAVSSADGATPGYAGTTCSGVYCHGATLVGAATGGTVRRAPIWTTVDGTFDACGASCHTNPPGGSHPVSTACASCHGAVIASWDPTTKTATWTDHTRHVNGVVETASLTCTSCHGSGADPAPPLGTKGETLTTQKAVGAHQQHLATGSTWRKDLACTDCHAVPIVTTHSNGTTDFTWSALSSADGAAPAYTSATATCAGAYCHGATLQGAIAGGTLRRTPSWTTVDGSFDACGASCHTNPPGGTHVTHTDCTICHSGVVSSYAPATKTATWTNRTLHVNGTIESHKYHDLTGWTSPGGGANHHGSNYFLTKQQKDEHGGLCTACHGADYNGGTVAVSCNNASCHKGTDWRGCSFCHGTPPSQNNPPLGVGGETLKTTLAVGRHVAHLTSSTTHAAFACSTCHAVPVAGDVAHGLGYVPTANLETAGHHGDVAFSAGATGMTFNVAATQGIPVTARGTCLGACHSNGRGGAPAVTPYWAGGAWPVGSCGSCHAGTLGSLPGRHGTHDGEGLTCASCHPAASSSTHMNGSKNVSSTITGPSGGATTTEAPGTAGNPCGTVTSCTGTCHGKGHSDRCWR